MATIPGSVRRIAVVAYHSSPLTEPGVGDAGGMTVYVRALADSLARRGLRTDIFTRAAWDVPRVCEIFPGVRIVSLEAGPRKPIPKDEQRRHVGEFAASVRAFATSQRMRYDLVHSHYWQSGLVASELSRMWGIPMVHSQHSLGRVKNRYLAPGDVPEPQVRIDGEHEVISLADILVASTDDEWEQLSCLYGASHDRLKIVHPGVDHRLFHPNGRAGAWPVPDVSPDAATLLFVGRIQPLKGLDLAIEALAKLKEMTPRRVELVVVGGPSGPPGEDELERLRRIAESLGVADDIRFLGPQPHTRLPSFYRAADILVVCSHSESFGLAALEAQACGTPVVATAIGGLGHIVADGVTGFLVTPRDATSFAARLNQLLGDRKLARAMSTAAAARATAFSWDVTADDFVELYECVVREDSPEVCTC